MEFQLLRCQRKLSVTETTGTITLEISVYGTAVIFLISGCQSNLMPLERMYNDVVCKCKSDKAEG